MKKMIPILSLLLLCAFSVQAQYYVDKSNNNAADNGNDGSEANPWLTIQYAIYQLNPGDILYIKAGTYYEKLYFEPSGTPGNIITIKNFENDEVIISGENSNNDKSIIWTGGAYQRIEGLHLTKNEFNYAQGLAIQGHAHHIEVINNKVSEINFSSDPNASVTSNTNSVPMSALGDDKPIDGADPDSVHHITFIGNEIFNNRTGYSENLTVGGNVSNFLMEDNYIHNNTNIGIDATGNYGESPVPAFDQSRYGIIKNNIIHDCLSKYSPSAGIYVDGGKNIVVENNLCYNNGYGGEIGAEQNGEAVNVIFRNNVFHHNTTAGMHFGGYDDNQGTVVNSQIYNNTFYQNDVKADFNGELILTRSKDCSIFNNIFYISSQNVFLYAYRTQTNLMFNYNLVYSVDGDTSIIEATINDTTAIESLQHLYTSTGYGTNSLFADPLFTDAANSDFHVSTSSPAVNAGDPNHESATEELDLDGAARTVGSETDIGVDEQAAPLPVEYLSPFQARLQSKGVLLSWVTSLELNADKFIIQRLSSKNEWISIQTIFAGRQNYQVLDNQPQEGINIYRLKQMDLDGKFTLSSLVSIVWEKGKPISLFPNPTSGPTFFKNDKAYNVQITNSLGQVVFFAEMTNQIPQLPKGMYGVTILSVEGRQIDVVQLIVD